MSEVNYGKYELLLRKLAHKFPIQFHQDLVHEGYLALHAAAEKFDSSKKVKFSTFAYQYVYFAMVKFLRSVSPVSSISLDEILYDEFGKQINDIVDESISLSESFEIQDEISFQFSKNSPIKNFIRQRFFEENMTHEEIINLYGELTQLKTKRALKKALYE